MFTEVENQPTVGSSKTPQVKLFWGSRFRDSQNQPETQIISDPEVSQPKWQHSFLLVTPFLLPIKIFVFSFFGSPKNDRHVRFSVGANGPEAWYVHLQRHRSLMVDLCQGQLRSQAQGRWGEMRDGRSLTSFWFFLFFFCLFVVWLGLFRFFFFVAVEVGGF